MSTAAAAAAAPDLLAAFSGHNDLLGGQPAYRRQRLAAARAFLEAHPDFDAWMAAPVDARRVELRRRPFAWQLVAFAIVSGWCRADPEFLFAKNFGHSIARWIAALFPADVDRLNAAAGRAGAADAEVAVREVLSLTVAFTGRPPSSLTVEDLDRLGEAIDTTPAAERIDATRPTSPAVPPAPAPVRSRDGRPARSAPPRGRSSDPTSKARRRGFTRDPPNAARLSRCAGHRPATQDHREVHQRPGHLRRVHL
jgi:hypothetical protein